jgi:transposase
VNDLGLLQSNRHMQNVTLTAEEFNTLIAQREAAVTEREALRGELKVVKIERDLLQEKLNAFLRKLFAAKSEVRGNGQSELFNEAEALDSAEGQVTEEVPVESAIEIAGHTRQKRGRKPLDPALPREIVRHELSESERICPRDGKALVEIGVETSEQLDIIPQQVRVIQHQRVKYACPCCDHGMKVTPVPARIIPRGLLTEAALAWVATSKYQDSLPLYRQAALLGRFGGDLSRNTLAGSMVKVGEAVQPIINLLRDHLLDAELVFGDETVIQVLKESGRAAQSKSYLWAQMNGTGPPVRLFGYAPGRGGTHAEQLVCRNSRRRGVDVRWLRGLQRHRAFTWPDSSGVLGACTALLCRGRGRLAESGSPSGSVGDAVYCCDCPALCRGGEGQGQSSSRKGSITRGIEPPHPGGNSASAGHASAQRDAGQFVGQGTALSGSTMAEADPVCRERRLAHRQQSVRERDPTVRRRAAQLALRRHGGRGQWQREYLFADRDLQG